MVENHHSELVCHYLPDGTLTYVNKAYCVYFGKSSRDLLGTSFFPFLQMEDLESLRLRIAELTPDCPCFTTERRVSRPGSHKHCWHQWTDEAIYNAEGELVEFRAVGRDITNEREARRSVHELQQILEHVPTCIWKYCPARQRVLYVSDHIVHLSGMRRKEVTRDLNRVLSRVDSGAESKQAWQGANEAIAAGEPFQVIFLFHTFHAGPRWFQMTGRPVHEEGELYYYGNTTDVTERRLAERAKIRLASALEQAGEAIVITDLEGKIQYVNPAFERITGYTREEAIGQRPNILKSGKQDAAFYRDLWQKILSGEIWRGRFINRCKDGSLGEYWATISPVRDPEGKVMSFVSVQMDMTQQQHLERQLRRAERLAAVGETIAGLAHYIKNIINSLKGSAYLIGNALERQEYGAIGSMWEIYARNTERLVELSQQMLNYVQTRKLDLEAVNLNPLVQEIYDSCVGMAASRRVNLVFTPGSELPRVPCDRTAIYDAILNLVCNAVDACAEQGGGSVSIRTECLTEEKVVQIAVEDTGPGIPAERLERIFEPFFSTKGAKGSGLGLAVVQKTVREHNGTINLDSRPGRTVFTVRLPM